MDFATLIYYSGVGALIYLAMKFMFRLLHNRNDDDNMIHYAPTFEDGEIIHDEETDTLTLPIKITKEEDMYYAWYASTKKFIYQSKSLTECVDQSYIAIFKNLGIKVTVEHEFKEA